MADTFKKEPQSAEERGIYRIWRKGRPVDLHRLKTSKNCDMK